jgi:ribosome recycling factor
VRNVRRDAISDVKELQKEKLITEDDEHKAQDDIQKITDKYVARIDALLEEKENEIMEF